MKGFNLLVLLALLFVSPYAFAQIPSCPCDTLELSNGTTGNEIVDILCPDGRVGEGTFFEVTPDTLGIFSQNMGYTVDTLLSGPVCEFGQDGFGTEGAKLTSQEFVDCKESLIQRCGLDSTDIPTLSEWGLIAMAGLMGVVGMIVALRRRRAAA